MNEEISGYRCMTIFSPQKILSTTLLFEIPPCFLVTPTPRLPPLTYLLLTSPSWCASLFVSLNNPDTDLEMSWTYMTLLALLAVLLALSCESDAG